MKGWHSLTQHKPQDYEHCRQANTNPHLFGKFFSTYKGVIECCEKESAEPLTADDVSLSFSFAQSFRHVKTKGLTSFGTLKIDIFELCGYGDSKNIYYRFGRVSDRPC